MKSTISQVNDDVLKAKKRLMETPIVENFGQAEIRALETKYGTNHTYDSQREKLRVYYILNHFVEWCQTFTPGGKL